MLERFVHRMSNRIILVDAQSSRPLLRTSHPTGMSEALRPHHIPLMDTRPARRRRTIRFPDGCEVSLRSFRFAAKTGGPSESEVRLTEIPIERVYTVRRNPDCRGDAPQHRPEHLWAFITSWCVASPEDQPELARGFVPAGLNQRVAGTDLNGAGLASIAAIHPRTGATDVYAYDLDRTDGRVQSIRKAKGSLRLIVEENALLGRHIHAALDGNKDEQIAG
jgi:hypothetical protein